MAAKSELDTAPSGLKPQTHFQRRMAEFDAIEAREARWQFRLRRLVFVFLLTFSGGYLMFCGYTYGRLFPVTKTGLWLHLGAYSVVYFFFYAAIRVDGWILEHQERYWLWRLTSVIVFAGVAGALLYGMYRNAAYWMPHLIS